MFPGMGRMNPSQMQGMMKQLGIKTDEIKTNRAVFETDDGNIIIENPQVVKMTVQGNEMYQVIGEARIESVSTGPKISEDDINMVAEQAKVSKEKAKLALEKTDGDIAEAIVMLTE